jgi:hypothetical protein
MAEATIGALANLATATAADRGVVTTLTEANACLVKQLEDNSNELQELNFLSIRRELKEGAIAVSIHILTIIVGPMATRSPTLTLV